MLAILTTHPIQYQVPLWQALSRADRVPFEVWYMTDYATKPVTDREFGRKFAWDIPLLEGYPHRFLEVNPGWVMDLSKPFRLRLLESLGARFAAQGVTHLLVNGWNKYAYWQSLWAAKKSGVKILLRGESNDLMPALAWRRVLRRKVHRLLFGNVDYFLYIGSANRRLYSKTGVPEERLHAAPYGVDNARFAAQAAMRRSRRSEIRRRWAIADDAYVVLFCGKFMEKKRPMDVVAAIEKLECRTTGNRPIHLLMVGTGALGGDLRAAANVTFDAEGGGRTSPSGSNRKPRASFVGFLNQTEISDAYVAADCLVLPSDYGETWGLVVNEAMASGLPCIVSDAVGCGEDMVLPVNPKLRFPLGDIEALGAALHEVQMNPPTQSALETQVNKFHIDITVNCIARIWERSLSAKQKPTNYLRHPV